MQKLLRAAKLHNNQLSAFQAADCTGLTIEAASWLLEEAVKAGYAEVAQDEKSGIVWVFSLNRAS